MRTHQLDLLRLSEERSLYSAIAIGVQPARQRTAIEDGYGWKRLLAAQPHRPATRDRRRCRPRVAGACRYRGDGQAPAESIKTVHGVALQAPNLDGAAGCSGA